VLDLKAIAENKVDDSVQTIKYTDISNVYSFPHPISACCFLPGGQHLVCGDSDGTILLLDHSTGLQLHSVRTHQRRITSCSFSQQARLLAVGDERGFVSVWDLADGRFTMVQLCK
jgi:WD40 repeat protein